MSEFFISWWWAIVIAVVAIVVTVIAILSNNTKIKRSLLYLVTVAEKEMKSGTGELKLQSVYSKFIEKFPIISTFIPYSVFTSMVDNALNKMQEMLSSNDNIDAYVKN